MVNVWGEFVKIGLGRKIIRISSFPPWPYIMDNEESSI